MKHPRLTYACAAAVVRLLVRLRVERRAALPPGAAVIACNHRSWIDPLLIVVALGPRRPVIFLAAREHVKKRRLLDALTRWLGVVILVDRESARQRDTLRAAERALAAGASLALFPEGRINVTDTPLTELEPGTAAIARRAAVPIVPLALAGSRELHLGRRVTLVIGPAFAPAPARTDDEHTTAQLRAAVLAALPATPTVARWQPGAWLRRLT